MKLAVLSESPADEAFVQTITTSVLGVATEFPASYQFRSRGWGSLPKLLPSVILELYYATDLDGLLVVADSNGTEPHELNHTPETAKDCRFCKLRLAADERMARLRPVPGRIPLRLAIGLAIPAIEAWYLCGKDPTVTEAAWVNGRREGKLPYTRAELKVRAYSTDRPSLDEEVATAISQSQRHAKDALTSLRQWFPAGCGSMLGSMEGWH